MGDLTETTDPIRYMRLMAAATDAKDKAERRTNAMNARTEVLSRLIAAEKMNLLDDAIGQRLPDELWQQAKPLAMAVMTLIRRDVS